MADQSNVPEPTPVDLDRIQDPSLLNPVNAPMPSDEMLRNISSFEEAQALAEELHGAIQDYAETYGTGFELLDDKSQLVGKPLVLLSWRINSGNFGGFVSAHAITESGDKYIVNDGSTGLYKQLAEITANSGRIGGLLVKKGLRESEYPICAGPVDDPRGCGMPRTAMDAECQTCGDTTDRRATGHTYYLDNS